MPYTNKIALAVVVIVLIAFPFAVNPYVVQVVITTIMYSMLGLAFALSMRVGLPRIDIAAWWGIGGYTTVLLINHGLSFWFATLISGLVTAVLGWVAFSLVLPRGMLQFFVFCLLAMLIAPNLLPLISKIPFLRGSGSIVPAPSIGAFELIVKRDLYYLGLLLLALTLLVYYLFYNSSIGRAWKAIGYSPGLARSLGIDVVRYRMTNILLGNFFIALAGSYYVAYYRAVTPLMFSLQSGVLIMVFPLVGGINHRLIGPIVGALIASFMPEYFNFGKEYQIIIYSVMVLIILIFLPQGILGWLNRRIKPMINR